MEKTKFRNDALELQDFLFEYKTLNGISKPIKLGPSLRQAIREYLPDGDRQKRLLQIVRRLMDGIIPDDDGTSQFSRSLPESLKKTLKKKDMSPINFVNFIINGGKEKDLKDSKKKNKGTHKMPDGTVMTGKTHNKDSKPVKEDEVRPATKPASTKEDEVRPSSGTTKAQKDKPKKKYDRPPAYCFTRKRDDGERYVTCVPGFV